MVLSDRERQLIAKCEEWGEDETRRMVLTGKLAGPNLKTAQAWLDARERARREESEAEGSALSRAQADAAHRSNVIAAWALAVAILALAVSVATAFKPS